VARRARTRARRTRSGSPGVMLRTFRDQDLQRLRSDKAQSGCRSSCSPARRRDRRVLGFELGRRLRGQAVLRSRADAADRGLLRVARQPSTRSPSGRVRCAQDRPRGTSRLGQRARGGADCDRAQAALHPLRPAQEREHPRGAPRRGVGQRERDHGARRGHPRAAAAREARHRGGLRRDRPRIGYRFVESTR